MAETDRIEVLTAAKLWPPMMESLRGAFAVHDRTHQSDAASFAAAAPRIRAIAASGESKVPRELIAQLPKLEIVSVFGVGYDGVDVAAARERGIAVTHTPNVLNDEVADLAMALVLAVSRRLIDAKVLAALGRKGYLVNVARGSVVDEQALVSALREGTIAGAALDVFENEPNVPAELLAFDNVVLTPHVGSATWQTRQAMADLAFGNLTAHFAGKPLLSPVP